jgi:hypothetical protein
MASTRTANLAKYQWQPVKSNIKSENIFYAASTLFNKSVTALTFWNEKKYIWYQETD